MRYFKVLNGWIMDYIVMREDDEGNIELLNIEGEWRPAATPTFADLKSVYSYANDEIVEITQEEAVYI